MDGRMWKLAVVILVYMAHINAEDIELVGSVGPGSIIDGTYIRIQQGGKRIFGVLSGLGGGSYAFKKPGVVFGFAGIFMGEGRIEAQILRPNGNGYTLLWHYGHEPTKPADLGKVNPFITDHWREEVEVRTSCFMVEAGDRVAFLSDIDEAPIGYVFDTDVQSFFFDFNGQPPEIDANFTFDPLGMPYRWQIAMAVDNDISQYNGQGPGTVDCRDGLKVPKGEDVVTTTPGPTQAPPKGEKGEQGLKGEKGDTGDDGPQGPKGDRGLQGVQGLRGDVGPLGDTGAKGAPGVPGADGAAGTDGVQGDVGPKGEKGESATSGGGPTAAPSTAECDCGGLLNRYVILGLIIWLLILTVLVMVVLVLVTKRAKKEKTSRQQRLDNNVYSNNGLRESPPWVDNLREDQWKDYTVETISNPS